MEQKFVHSVMMWGMALCSQWNSLSMHAFHVGDGCSWGNTLKKWTNAIPKLLHFQIPLKWRVCQLRSKCDVCLILIELTFAQLPMNVTLILCDEMATNTWHLCCGKTDCQFRSLWLPPSLKLHPAIHQCSCSLMPCSQCQIPVFWDAHGNELLNKEHSIRKFVAIPALPLKKFDFDFQIPGLWSHLKTSHCKHWNCLSHRSMTDLVFHQNVIDQVDKSVVRQIIEQRDTKPSKWMQSDHVQNEGKLGWRSTDFHYREPENYHQKVYVYGPKPNHFFFFSSLYGLS